MHIELRSVESIKPYEGNPRKNDAAVDAVARSIVKFGFRQPIVVDADGVIVVGHTRWRAAGRLGLKEVPVHVASELTPEEAKASPGVCVAEPAAQRGPAAGAADSAGRGRKVNARRTTHAEIDRGGGVPISLWRAIGRETRAKWDHHTRAILGRK